MNKKFLIVLLGIGIIAGIGLSFYTTRMMNHHVSVPSPQKTTKQPSPATSTSAEKSKSGSGQSVQLNPMNGQTPSSTSKSALSQSKIQLTEAQVRTDYRKYDFTDGEQTLVSLSNTYNLTGNAQVLYNLMYDGALFENFQTTPLNVSATVNPTDINIMKGLKDPEDVLIGFLMLNEPSREQTVVDVGSFSPTTNNQPIIVLDSSTVTGTLLNQVKMVAPSTKTLYKIHFELDGSAYDGYVVENTDGTLHMFGIDNIGKALGYSIAQWEQMDQNQQNGVPMMQGVAANPNATLMGTLPTL